MSDSPMRVRPKRVWYKKDEFEIYPFRWRLQVVITNDAGMYCFRKHLGHLRDKEEPFVATVVRHIGECRSTMVLEKSNKGGEIGTLAHEAYHVVCQIYDGCGVDNPDEEYTAYLLGDMVNDVLNSIERMSKKKIQICHPRGGKNK